MRMRSEMVCAGLFCLVLSGPMLAQSTTDAAAQKPSEGAQQPTSMGGSSAGAPHAAVLDEKHRPITAGGFVKTGPAVFEDISERSGLSTWHHTMGDSAKPDIIDTVGSGVGLLDYDNDGWLDIYLVNGSTVAAEAGKATPPHAALFHNNHDGTFTDVAAKAGVTNDRWGFGVAIADYDNDGWPDLYVTNFGKNRLFHNNHDGTFTDVAEKDASGGGERGADGAVRAGKRRDEERSGDPVRLWADDPVGDV